MGNKTLTALSDLHRDESDPVPQDNKAGLSKSTPPRRRKRQQPTKNADIIPAFLPERTEAGWYMNNAADAEDDAQDPGPDDSREEEPVQTAEPESDEAIAAEDGGDTDSDEEDTQEDEIPPIAAQHSGDDAGANGSVSDPELIVLLEQLSATIDNANQVLSETPGLAADPPEPVAPGIPGPVAANVSEPGVPETWRTAQQPVNPANRGRSYLPPAFMTGLLLAIGGVGYWWFADNPWLLDAGDIDKASIAASQQSVSLKIPIPAVAVPLPSRKPVPAAESAEAAAPADEPVKTAAVAEPSPSADPGTPMALPEAPAAAAVKTEPQQASPAAVNEPPADDEVAAITEALAPTPETAPATLRGTAGQPIKLGLSAPATQNAAEVSVMIQGVPEGVKLSSGSRIGGGTWVLEDKELEKLTLLTPKTFSPREFALDVAFVKSNGKIPESRSIRVVVEQAPSPVTPATHGLAAADTGKTPPAQTSALAVRGPAPGGTIPEQKAEPAPVQPSQPVQQSLSPEQEDSLLGKGDELLKLGDVASARLIFEHAARRGSTRAMMKLGKTYDPEHLSKLGVQGVQADITQATAWYERASRKADR